MADQCDEANVRFLERKICLLERQMLDLKCHVVENEQKLAAERRRKIDSQFKQKFKQQRLPAWQPILTADTVLPAFFLIGLLFIPLGAALLYFSDIVQEKEIDYTNCNATELRFRGQMCQDVLEILKPGQSCTCKIEFTLDKTFEKNVYMYYGLSNFYQNHRRYVKSRDDNQLYGKKVTDVSSSCSSFDEEDGKIYAPCGAIANSMFNDTLKIIDKDGEEVATLNTGIAWTSDKERKYNNPAGSTDPDAPDFKFADTIKPKYWSKPVYELDENWSNNGYENEDLIVWMRTAAFPNFRKLYRRIDHTKDGYISGMPQETYTLVVDYSYPVKSFNGRKRFILSTTSFLGGKNNFLGIAYITVGCICLLLGVVFLIIHIKYGKRPADLQNITQNTPFTE